MKRKSIAFLSTLFVLLLLSSSLTACGGGANAASSTAAYAVTDYYDDYVLAEEEYAYEGVYSTEESYETLRLSSEGLTAGGTLTNDKLIYTCDLRMETTEYANAVEAIQTCIAKYGAIIEYQSENDNDYYWYESSHTRTSGTLSTYLTIRVPSESYGAFVEELSSLAKVRSKNQNVQNISREYHSTEARIEVLETEEARLKDMLDKAQTIEEMILIEQRLTEVESELNIYRTNLASMDLDVTYSTVNVNLQEVLVYTEEETPAVTFPQRLAQSFKNSWSTFLGFLEGAVTILIYLIPFLLVGIAILIIILVLKKHKTTGNTKQNGNSKHSDNL